MGWKCYYSGTADLDPLDRLRESLHVICLGWWGLPICERKFGTINES